MTSNLVAHDLTSDSGVALLTAALVTGGVLAAAIAIFQPVSGAHFNPAVSIAEAFDGRLAPHLVLQYIVAQSVGAVSGVAAANLLYGESVLVVSDVARSGAAFVAGEVLVTFGLVGLIVGLVRSGRTTWVAAAVGTYVAAGHFLSPSTGFANPAVTIARTLAAGPGGIAPGNAWGFIAAQVLAGFVVGLVARRLGQTGGR